MPDIKVFAFKANKRYDYYNNHLTTQFELYFKIKLRTGKINGKSYKVK